MGLDSDKVSELLMLQAGLYADTEQALTDSGYAEIFSCFIADHERWRTHMAELIVEAFGNYPLAVTRFVMHYRNGSLVVEMYAWDHFVATINTRVSENWEYEIELVQVTSRESLIRYMEEDQISDPGKNRMGCSESYYDPFFVIKKTLSADAVKAMSEDELGRLLGCLNTMSEGLY